MSTKTADIDRVFSKLKLETREGKDRIAWFVHGGKRILYTGRSHGRGDVAGRMVDVIRQQLKVNETQFHDLISCHVKRDEYLAILRNKGIIEL